MLALESGIPPDVWAEQGERAIATAVEVLAKRDEDMRPPETGPDGEQMSG